MEGQYSYQIHHACGEIHQRLAGPVSELELVLLLKQLQIDPDYRPQYRVATDLTHCELLVERHRQPDLARLLAPLLAPVPGCAVAAATEAQAAFASLAQAAAPSPRHLQVFSHPSIAVAYLSLQRRPRESDTPSRPRRQARRLPSLFPAAP